MPAPSYFSCALITGASSGLGEEFALQIAPRVEKLVLVARRESLLHQLADRIRARHPKVAVAVYAVDLTQATQRERLLETLASRGVMPDLLINNAGIGDYGEFATSDWEKLSAMLRVNIEALTHLTHGLVPEMIKRGGAIINISSLASLLPIPDFAVYAATKAYVTSFTEALRIELREHHIPVLAVCPGPVHTEFGNVAARIGNESREMPTREWFYVPRDQVVAASLRALDRKVARVYPGLKTAVAAVVISAAPILLLRWIMGFRPRK